MKEVTVNTINVHGPEELKGTLIQLLEKSKQDPNFAKNDHWILCQLGEQKSLIKAVFTEDPYQIYYNDLFGRSISSSPAIKKTLIQFLNEECGQGSQAEKNLHDHFAKKLHSLVDQNMQNIVPGESPWRANEEIKQMEAENWKHAQPSQKQQPGFSNASIAWMRLWHHAPTGPQNTPENTPTNRPKKS